MNNNENYWKILSEINDAIKFAETKGIAIISTSGILTAFLFSKKDLNTEFNNCSFFVLFILCIAFLFLSILFSLLSVKPNFSIKSKYSFFYFNSIVRAHKNETDFKENIKKALSNENEIQSQLTEQIYTKSKIAKRKFKFINISIYSFIIFLTLLLVLMIIK